jgi:serine/threonine-protein kinase
VSTSDDFAGDTLLLDAASAKACPACKSRFSSDARFCPFDGEPLERAGAEPPRDPLVGTTVDGRYRVEAVLGEGGMGIVYRVRHTVLERALALKVLRADLATDGDLGLRFTREAKAAASISHPSVVQITDFGVLPSAQPYFVMELLIGEPLSAIVRKGGPLPAARAVRLLVQMVEALEAAHSAGVIHRDLKPDNILVCAFQGAETVKILDFGLAKVAGQSRLTKKGLVFGTPHYMSPEQAGGGGVDERTDIYALGVVMYEMFTGRVPFEADTYMGVLTKHLYVAPTPPSVIIGDFERLGALEQVTLRCLEKKPEKRYPAMSALLEELRRVAWFSEDGALRVQPMEPMELQSAPRLADELELPSQLEMKLAMRRAGLTTSRVPLAPAIAGAGIFVVALLAFAYQLRGVPNIATLPTASATESVAPAPSPAAHGVQAERAVGAGDVTVLALPAVVSAAPNAAAPTVGPSDSAAVGANDTNDPNETVARAARSPRTKAVSRRGATTARAAGRTPPVTRNSSTELGKVVGSEVIDPWSR